MKTSAQIIEEIHKILIPHVSNSLVSPILIPKTFNIAFICSPTKTINFTTHLSGLTPISTIVSQLEALMKENNIRM